ncbi:MAG: peptidoglycan DD-metalloendopeptidase family protein [Bacteroidales bacterium]
MRRAILILGVLLSVSCGSNEADQNTIATTPPQEEMYEFGIPVSKFEMKEGTVKSGQFFSTLMSELGVSNTDAYSLTKASEGIFDLKKIKVGNSYKAFYTTNEEPKLAYLVYESDKKTFVTFCLNDSVYVKVNEIETSVKMRVGETTIKSSLWADMKDAGINPVLAIRLSDIYAWSIDFFGLQKGDSFKVLYDEIYAGDKLLDIGTVHAAIFRHAGKDYYAYRFMQGDTTGYWNDVGENLQKAFLKAPLKFSRISSGFTYSRRHPVTRIVRPHTGIDYAAPKGTPVMSIGSGVVIQKGYAGGGGHTVKIKHNATYTSAYLHLSAYGKGIAKGARVSQGQIIGYVGSTGLSTGPHLDFRIWKNNTPINPLKMESPPAQKILAGRMAEFKKQIEMVKYQTDSLVSLNVLDTLVSKLGKR